MRLMPLGTVTFVIGLAPVNFASVEMPSRLIDRAVDQIAGLPGVGRRTALRLALHLLGRNEEDVRRFTEAIQDMKEGVLSCSTCGNLGEEEVCSICLDGRRDPSRIAIVEDLRDLLAIESTGHFKGRYHVLGGVISPMDGIGPADLRIESLLGRAGNPEVKEVIFALPTTMEGDTTAFYINKRLQGTEIEVTTLARGVAVGDELQYADELTLIRSLQQRLPYSVASNANNTGS
jgi:recombination protein RecR